MNRNYDFLWDFPVAFDPTVADGSNPTTLFPPASADPTSDLYHGASPLSEPECKNVVWVLDTFPRIGWYVDIHSFTGDVLYAWGDAPDQTTNPSMNFANAAFDGRRGVSDASVYGEFIAAQDQAAVQAASAATVAAINAVRGQTYQSRQDFFLSVGQATGPSTYPTSGAVDDYAFSRSHGGATNPRVYAFTLEVGIPPDFQPPFPEMGNIIDDVDAGLLAFCLFSFDPCAIVQQNVDDLEAELQAGLDAFVSGELPQPRTAANIAAFQAKLAGLRRQVVSANRALHSCRSAHETPTVSNGQSHLSIAEGRPGVLVGSLESVGT